MKNKIESTAFVVWTAIVFIAGWFLCDYFRKEVPPVTINQGEIIDNHPKVDVTKIEIDELRRLVDCYANRDAYLNLFVVDGNIIKAEAGLCDRKWSRTATVETKLQKNYMIANVSYPVGAIVSYYRRVGPVALGGGASFINLSPGIHFGAMYGW